MAKRRKPSLKKRNPVARDEPRRPAAGAMKDKRRPDRRERKIADEKRIEEETG